MISYQLLQTFPWPCPKHTSVNTLIAEQQMVVFLHIFGRLRADYRHQCLFTLLLAFRPNQTLHAIISHDTEGSWTVWSSVVTSSFSGRVISFLRLPLHFVSHWAQRKAILPQSGALCRYSENREYESSLFIAAIHVTTLSAEPLLPSDQVTPPTFPHQQPDVSGKLCICLVLLLTSSRLSRWWWGGSGFIEGFIICQATFNWWMFRKRRTSKGEGVAFCQR